MKNIYLVNGVIHDLDRENLDASSRLSEKKLVRYMGRHDHAAVEVAMRLLENSRISKDQYGKIGLYTSVGHHSYFPENFWQANSYTHHAKSASSWFACMYSPVFHLSKILQTHSLGVVTGPTSLETAQAIKSAYADLNNEIYEYALIVAVSVWSDPAAVSELKRFELKDFTSKVGALLLKREASSNKKMTNLLKPEIKLLKEKSDKAFSSLTLLDVTYPIKILMDSNGTSRLHTTYEVKADQDVFRRVNHELVDINAGS